ncbi:hypothetical protein BS47DRAFT_1294887 [Hydnum rufescens UP504]|uniref:Tc1-like transposase DDE domain-containing protein n=1 Tax=Hydnum rufescens UP504 TaxID=1448309 RepID=A0A9P6DXJ2_9AGAM|nr:hypothetical protein BS47DRAFT_1294887 [Hydnum rufescens UP504]
MLYFQIWEGAFNSEAFLTFIKDLLMQMQPFPTHNSVIMMDNCQIHKDPHILEAITDVYVF